MANSQRFVKKKKCHVANWNINGWRVRVQRPKNIPDTEKHWLFNSGKCSGPIRANFNKINTLRALKARPLRLESMAGGCRASDASLMSGSRGVIRLRDWYFGLNGGCYACKPPPGSRTIHLGYSVVQKVVFAPFYYIIIGDAEVCAFDSFGREIFWWMLIKTFERALQIRNSSITVRKTKINRARLICE